MNKKNKLEYEENDFLLKNGIVYGLAFWSMLISIAIYLSEPFHSYVTNNITTATIIPYIVFILIFILAVVVCNYVLLQLNIVQKMNRCNRSVARIISVGLFALIAGMLLYIYKTELKVFDAPDGLKLQYHINDTITIILMIAVFFAVVYVIESIQVTHPLKKESRLFFYLFALVIAIVYGFTLYTPNCFSDYSNLYNGDAYFNSVYRAMMGVPRSYLDSGVYGCYGILLAPVVNLFGGTFSSFYVVLGCLGGICILCMAYAIDTLVRNPLIKIMGTLALTISIMAMQWTVYNQLYPHRVFFSAIMVAYMAGIHRHKRTAKGWIVGGYVLCTVSIIWNIETGMACLIGWMAYSLFDAFVQYSITQAALYKRILLHLAAGIASFFGAIASVTIINILMGGSAISIRDFLFPIVNSSYMKDVLIYPLPKGLSAWLVVIGSFLFLLANCMMKTKFSPLRLSASTRDRVFMGVAVLGLGQILYFINRAVYGNLSIVHYIFILVLCIISDWCLEKYLSGKGHMTPILNGIYRYGAYLSVTVLVVITLGGVSNYFSVELYKNTADTDYRNTSEIENTANLIEQSIPKNTRAIGSGVTELYSYLHWDAYYYTIDFPDLGVIPEASVYLNNELKELQEPILINADSLAILDEYSENKNQEFHDKHILVKTFTVYDRKFCYYEPVTD